MTAEFNRRKADNFSYNIIDEGEEIVIPEFQQMIVQQAIQINGNLINEGSLVVIN